MEIDYTSESVSKGTTSHFTRGGFAAPERTSDTTTRQDARCRPFVETSLVNVVATGGFAVDDLFVVCDEVEAADGAVVRDGLARGGFVVCMLRRNRWGVGEDLGDLRVEESKLILQGRTDFESVGKHLLNDGEQ